jgi:CheY-like chemotaxis protein
MTGEGYRILVAEDEANIRRLIRLTLESEQLEIVEAVDGPSALALAREMRARLVFLDWRMPGCSGLEVCRLLRADPQTADAKVIMVTARSQPPDRRAAEAAGADEMIAKPFSPLKLLDIVRDVLGPDALL